MRDSLQRTAIPRPRRGEYDPYYERYVRKVPHEPVLEVLERQRRETIALLSGLDETRACHRYAAGKWSVKEVLGHLVDVERVFAARALWFARDQVDPLPDMDADGFVRTGEFDRRPLPELTSDYDAARRSTVTLCGSFNATQLSRRGTAAGCEFSVSAIVHVIAGHERHHLDILAQKYGLSDLFRA